jgi:glutamine---fructose-6-phosphate transaminase (isomerizing)
MCGIVGYVGHRPACDVVIDALCRMEYRGYDSAGVALVNGRGTLTVRRRAGRLANLEAALDATDPVTLSGHSALGHTRWATHGQPTDRNAHPRSDAVKIAVVHNGIIENFAALRRELEAAGVQFASDTDTEVAVHLVAQQYRHGDTASDSFNLIDDPDRLARHNQERSAGNPRERRVQHETTDLDDWSHRERPHLAVDVRVLGLVRPAAIRR